MASRHLENLEITDRMLLLNWLFVPIPKSGNKRLGHRFVVHVEVMIDKIVEREETLGVLRENYLSRVSFCGAEKTMSFAPFLGDLKRMTSAFLQKRAWK